MNERDVLMLLEAVVVEADSEPCRCMDGDSPDGCGGCLVSRLMQVLTRRLAVKRLGASLPCPRPLIPFQPPPPLRTAGGRAEVKIKDH